MKAYGLASQAPMDCCPGHSRWAVQSKYLGGRGPRFDRDASRRPFKKRARASGRAEMAADAWDAELEAAGVEGAFAPFRKRDYVPPAGPDDFFLIAEESYQAYLRYGSDRCTWCGSYDGCDCTRCGWGWDYYDDYEYMKCWNCSTYRDFCSCGHVDVLDAAWVALWVDGKVSTPYDADDAEYDAWMHEGYADHYPYWPDDYDSPNFCEGWGDQSGPATPATIAITREREQEKLKAGNRYYLQNRRAA